MKLEWTPAMSTGVEEIDAQHKEFLHRLNLLLRAMMAGAAREKVGGLFDFLGEYVATHFSTEEACMARHRCPAAARNREAHAKFVETFERLRRRHAEGGADPLLVIEVQRDLADWFVHHICAVDTQLRPCVRGGAA